MSKPATTALMVNKVYDVGASKAVDAITVNWII